MVGAATRWGVGVVRPFGRSAQSRPSALLARPLVKLLAREQLGRKGASEGQAALNFIGTFLFFSKRLRSLRAIAFPGGFVPSHELSAQASQWRDLRENLKRLQAASKIRVW